MQGFFLGLLALAGFLFQTWGLASTSAARSSFLTASLVIWTPLLQWLCLGRPPAPSTLGGILLACLGISFFAWDSGGGISWRLYEGDLWTLLCAFVFSIFIIFLDVFDTSHNTGSLLFYKALTGALGALFLALYHPMSLPGEGLWAIERLSLLFWVLYLAILGNGLALFYQMRYQPFTSPARAGVISVMEPISASILALVLIGEGMSLYEIIGAAFVILAILFMELSAPFALRFFLRRNNKASR